MDVEGAIMSLAYSRLLLCEQSLLSFDLLQLISFRPVSKYIAGNMTEDVQGIEKNKTVNRWNINSKGDYFLSGGKIFMF